MSLGVHSCAGVSVVSVRNRLGGPGLYQPLAVMRLTVVVTANTSGLSPPEVASTQPPSSHWSSQGFVSLSLTMYPSGIWPFLKETPVPLASSFLVPW